MHVDPERGFKLFEGYLCLDSPTSCPVGGIRSFATILTAMARIGRLAFLAIAVVFHLVYIYSIFDVYFVSPIVNGMKAFQVDAPKAPAKRLVLYVGMSKTNTVPE